MAPTTEVEWSKPSEDPESELRRVNAVRPPRGPNFNTILPLAWIPAICLIRFGLRGAVTNHTRDLIFGGAVIGALTHAAWMMSGDTTM